MTFLKLPEPKQPANLAIEEVQDEFLKKKEEPTEKPNKQKIKISVPSLAQFDSDDDDDDTVQKVPKVISKASGLFALLPPPKGTPLSNKSFIPNVLTRKSNLKPPTKQKKPAPPKPVNVKQNAESDDEDIMKDIPETFDEETWKKVCAPTKKPQKRTINDNKNIYIEQTNIEIAPEAPQPYEGLDNDAFKQLVGSSKRRKENIKLIDINEDEVLTDKDLWITKSLTDPNMVPKEDVEDPVNDTCRRKHHITYLAQQVGDNIFLIIYIFFILFYRLRQMSKNFKLNGHRISTIGSSHSLSMVFRINKYVNDCLFLLLFVFVGQ